VIVPTINPFRSLVAPVFLLYAMIEAELRAVLITLEIEIPTTSEDIGKTSYGAVLLMIAFIISTMILAIGARFLGLEDIRIRAGLSVSFFLLVFGALVIYDNLKRRFG